MTLKQLIDNLKNLDRLSCEIEYNGCGDPECCGVSNGGPIMVSRSYGEYVRLYDIEMIIDALEKGGLEVKGDG
jgi:hypothetical protein